MEESTASDFSISLPDGYSGERENAHLLAVIPAEREAVRSSGLLDPGFPGEGASPVRSRGRARIYRIPLSSGSALVRPLAHGGLLRFLTGERFSDPLRSIRELIVSVELRREGVNVPEPVAAAAVRAGKFFRLFYVSREVTGRDLYEFLGAESSPARRRKVLRAAGRLIHDLHRLGVLHSDLHPKNLFVEAETQRLSVLDLDRTERGRLPSQGERVRNLARLYRFGQRRKALGEGQAWDEGEFRLLLNGYVDGDPEALYEEILDLYSRKAWLHRLGWKLEAAARGRD